MCDSQPGTEWDQATCRCKHEVRSVHDNIADQSSAALVMMAQFAMFVPLQGMSPRRVDTRDIPCRDNPQQFYSARSYSGQMFSHIYFMYYHACEMGRFTEIFITSIRKHETVFMLYLMFSQYCMAVSAVCCPHSNIPVFYPQLCLKHSASGTGKMNLFHAQT